MKLNNLIGNKGGTDDFPATKASSSASIKPAATGKKEAPRPVHIRPAPPPPPQENEYVSFDDWKKLKDKKSGRFYYWNTKTDETTALGARKPPAGRTTFAPRSSNYESQPTSVGRMRVQASHTSNSELITQMAKLKLIGMAVMLFFVLEVTCISDINDLIASATEILKNDNKINGPLPTSDDVLKEFYVEGDNSNVVVKKIPFINDEIDFKLPVEENIFYKKMIGNEEIQNMLDNVKSDLPANHHFLILGSSG